MHLSHTALLGLALAVVSVPIASTRPLQQAKRLGTVERVAFPDPSAVTGPRNGNKRSTSDADELVVWPDSSARSDYTPGKAYKRLATDADDLVVWPDPSFIVDENRPDAGYRRVVTGRSPVSSRKDSLTIND
ncbi:hypothetical protein BJ878DRAFT_234298 [Calycina marina]|uniref:Uncharacterized protein n=1 Tax=Calycina marina TaxID=1763456 RepID=A0A9P7YX63_9HELO|nr:hypothetical protein BJ878DRAFT_234298 [Calycina marina]